MLMDISDYEGLDSIKQAYLDIDKALEFVPEDGVYAVPYVANAAGVLYNRAMFEEYGWEIPETWDEFIALCEQIQSEGIQPLYFGFKDTWTCLAPWNAIAVDLAPADVCSQVNKGETTFSDEYRQRHCLHMDRKILSLMITMELVQHLQTENLQCTRSEVMQSHRFRQ